jgi:hypothetical protein
LFKDLVEIAIYYTAQESANAKPNWKADDSNGGTSIDQVLKSTPVTYSGGYRLKQQKKFKAY